jgi:hypothetical protein
LTNLNKFDIIILVFASFISGGILLSSEILIGKLVGIYYGNMVLTWILILTITLSAIFMGYKFGAKISKNQKVHLYHVWIALFIFYLFYYFTKNNILDFFLILNYELGLFCSIFVFLFPIIFLLSSITPISIKLISNKLKNAYGTILGFSTIGGVLFTVYVSVELIPYKGISFILLSYSIICAVISAGLFFLLKKR